MSESVVWRRSRRCDSNTCVEVARLDAAVATRDGKDPLGPALRFSRAGWAAFLAGLRAGYFDRP